MVLSASGFGVLGVNGDEGKVDFEGSRSGRAIGVGGGRAMLATEARGVVEAEEDLAAEAAAALASNDIHDP